MNLGLSAKPGILRLLQTCLVIPQGLSEIALPSLELKTSSLETTHFMVELRRATSGISQAFPLGDARLQPCLSVRKRLELGADFCNLVTQLGTLALEHLV